MKRASAWGGTLGYTRCEDQALCADMPLTQRCSIQKERLGPIAINWPSHDSLYAECHVILKAPRSRRNRRVPWQPQRFCGKSLHFMHLASTWHEPLLDLERFGCCDIKTSYCFLISQVFKTHTRRMNLPWQMHYRKCTFLNCLFWVQLARHGQWPSFRSTQYACHSTPNRFASLRAPQRWLPTK